MTTGERRDSLRDILNSWDPVGVAEIAPDEYDCLHESLVQLLSTGHGQDAVASFLREQLETHFGLDQSNPRVDTTAREIVAWWSDSGHGDAVHD